MTPQGTPMKALTLWQPWASLIANAVKTIETRSWSTSYRGPLAIHAATRSPELVELGEWTVRLLGPERVMHKTPYKNVTRSLPLGAVVATCRLFDVVPMLTSIEQHPLSRYVRLERDGLWLYDLGSARCMDVSRQLPYGYFTAGRFAWLLDDIQPVTPAIAAEGRRGLWEWDGGR